MPEDETPKFSSDLQSSRYFDAFSTLSGVQKTPYGFNLIKRHVVKVGACSPKACPDHSSDQRDRRRFQTLHGKYELSGLSCSIFFNPIIGLLGHPGMFGLENFHRSREGLDQIRVKFGRQLGKHSVPQSIARKSL